MAGGAVRFGIGAIAVAAALPTRAQTLDQFLPPDLAGVSTEPDVTVQSRLRPEYDPLGIRAGAFLLQPTASESVGYDSNVIGTSKPQGSPIFETTAGLSATTRQSRVSLSAGLTVDDVRYTDQPDQSHTDWTGRLSGSYILGQDVVSVDYAHIRESETLQDLGVSQLLSRALPFQIDDGRVSYRSDLSRAFVVPALEVVNYAYTNLVTDGVTYSQNYRNHVAVQPSMTLGYELAPRRDVITVVRGAVANYDDTPAGLARRNYNEVTVLAGIDYDVTGLLRVRALAGYQSRSFKSPQYKNINAPVLEGTLIWNPTGLTTVTGTATRSIQDSPDSEESAVTNTVAQIRVDHELYRNVLLNATARFEMDDYTQQGTSQTEYSLGTGVNYLINRNMTVGAAYTFTQRSSSGNNLNIGLTNTSLASSYSDHRIVLQLKLGF